MAKGPEAFRTISEASDELGVPQHVLRFWEGKFSFIRPMKRAGGRRFYRPQDLLVLRGVQALLHDEGYTIKGVQKLHREHGVRRLLAAANSEASEADLALDAFDEEETPRDAAPGAAPEQTIAHASGLAAIADDLARAKAELDRLLAAR